MELINTVILLLTKNKPFEALTLLKSGLFSNDDNIGDLTAHFEHRLSSSTKDLELGNSLTIKAMNERIRASYELERALKNVLDPTLPLGRPTILFIGSKPNGLPITKIDSEYVAIKETLQEADFHFTLPINSSIRPNKFGTLLQKHAPTYLHFAGHGVKAVPGFNSQGIVFEAPNKDPIVPPNTAVISTLRSVLKTTKIKGVILNACHSFQLAKEISELGIYAIGMLDEISDNSAIAFSEGFYSNFGTFDQDVEQAFEYGVNNIGMYGEEYLPFTGIPAIYQNGNKLN